MGTPIPLWCFRGCPPRGSGLQRSPAPPETPALGTGNLEPNSVAYKYFWYTFSMKMPCLLLLLELLALTAARAQQPPDPALLEPTADALVYERDFELLLEEAGVPTLGQVELERQIAALGPERAAAEKKLAGLQKRLSALDNNYTLEELAEEFARQGVSDTRAAQAGLKAQIAEVQLQLEKLARKERDLKERRNR